MSASSNTGYWDTVFAENRFDYARIEPIPAGDPACEAAHAHFGDLRGRTLLDLGCGRGATSLFFAERGARVIALDASSVAVENLRRHCVARGVQEVVAVQARAHDLRRALADVSRDAGGEATVDFVFGSMILHHVEPFREFVPELRAVVRPGGRGFFYENNARSRLLVWFRDHVVGRGWVPKFGDPDEFPLTPDEVDALRQAFTVDVAYPRLKFFELVAQYLLRGAGVRACEALDRWAYQALPALRPHSYVQWLYLS
jgi:SAM-dependent methyltransferase